MTFEFDNDNINDLWNHLDRMLNVNITSLQGKFVTGVYKHKSCEEFIIEFNNDLLLIIGTNTLFVDGEDYWQVETRQSYLDDEMDYRIDYIKLS